MPKNDSSHGFGLKKPVRQDLDRKESAALLHAQHAMRKFAVKAPRLMDVGRGPKDLINGI